jgi:gamma-glutamyltranspeptidase/glutathione hydrolase
MRFLYLFILLVFTNPVLAIPTEGHKIMYAGPTELAVPVVQRIAEQGGNIVDAAVAVTLALSVTTTYYGSLGGGGFAMVKMGHEVNALDFRETAPAAMNRDFFKSLGSEASITGGNAIGVPGNAAGLWALHQKYGKLKWTQLFESALRYASSGFPVSGEWAAKAESEKARFNTNAKSIFFKKNGAGFLPGEGFKQPKLALALKEFRKLGPSGFYQGSVALDIVKAVREAGGTLTAQDLKNYKVRWLKPMVAKYADHSIYLMPPPSSGGVVIQTALALIEKLKLREKPLLSVDELHLLGEIESRAYRGRSLLGDPDFVKNPLGHLLSANYLEELARSINPRKASEMKPLAEGSSTEKSETTNFAVMDNLGNAIDMTITLNGTHGSAVATSRYGIMLNNEIDDFTTKPGVANMYGLIQGDANAVAPGKRPLSSMSPTIIEKNGKTVMALGAPGGPRIISAVLQVIYRVIGREVNVDQAIQMPRVHHQFLPNILYVEPRRLSPEVIQQLRERKHKVEESWNARVNLVRLRPDGVLEAAFDTRGEGGAGGI